MDRISLVIVGILVLLAGATWVISNRAADFAVSESSTSTGAVTVSADPIAVEVTQGESPSAIASKLERAGVIRSAAHFGVLAGLMGVESNLRAGEYELTQGMPTAVVIDRLRENLTVPQFVLTIPEGWRWEQVGEHLERKGIASAADFESALQATDYNAPFLAQRPAGASLEGYLFPDTYFFGVNATAHDIVARLLTTFNEKFPPELQAMAANQGLSLHQAVTLASIVEREAQVPSERPVIASVYLNRIKDEMLLQADPTTQYAITADPASVEEYGWWKRDLTVDDLKVDSPFNTYVSSGLPPGPIASPGLASLEAVVRPAGTEFLYFVAKPDGSHAFARTLDEHNRNVQQYQQ
ncbi:MAG: endolytic transglycosylase MltG [Dehalococcoidia bacterium]